MTPRSRQRLRIRRSVRTCSPTLAGLAKVDHAAGERAGQQRAQRRQVAGRPADHPVAQGPLGDGARGTASRGARVDTAAVGPGDEIVGRPRAARPGRDGAVDLVQLGDQLDLDAPRRAGSRLRSGPARSAAWAARANSTAASAPPAAPTAAVAFAAPEMQRLGEVLVGKARDAGRAGWPGRARDARGDVDRAGR